MRVSVKSRKKQKPKRVHVPELADDTTDVFTNEREMNPAEREAVNTGFERGKKVYMQENPNCGLCRVTDKYRKNYDEIDWSEN